MARLIGFDLLGSIAWFPVWWYSEGIMLVLGKIRSALRYRIRQFGFRIWLKNFFVPMYGQYSFTGRAVSLFMRTVVLIGRCIALGIEALVYAVGLMAWTAAPIVFALLLLSNLLIRPLFGSV